MLFNGYHTHLSKRDLEVDHGKSIMVDTLNHCITLLLLRPKAELLVKQHFCFQTERYRLFLKMTIYKHFQSAFAKQRKTYAIPVENICSGIRVLDQINLS